MLDRIQNRLRFALYQGRGSVIPKTRVRHDDLVFTMGTRSPEETQRALSFSSKEPETLAWIDAFEGELPVFYDIGANVGIYSLYCKARHPGSIVYCFEPEAQSFAALCRNIKMNGYRDILAFQVAASSDVGLGTLFVSTLSPGAGASALSAEYQFQKAKGESFKQGIFHLSVDGMVEQFGLPAPNYLKIDVDGLEEAILAGAPRVLSDSRLRGLLVEFQYGCEEDVAPAVAKLAEHGLHLAQRSDWVSSGAGLLSRNYIFKRA